MYNFGERIKEEIDLLGFDIESYSNKIDVPKIMVYEWCSNKTQPSFKNLIKLANSFKCSVDYLLDREEKYENITFKECPQFAVQFEKLIKQYNITKNAMSNKTGISRKSIYDYLQSKVEPTLVTLIKISDFLYITIDVLIGRQ